MRAVRLVLVSVFLSSWIAAQPVPVEPPAAAQEVLRQIEAELTELERKTEADLSRWRDRTATALKEIQDRFCRDGKLDEAVAVRDAIRTLESGNGIPRFEGSPVVRKLFRPFEDEVIALIRKAEDRYIEAQEKATEELKKVQAAFCKEAKLEEALAVRDLIRGDRNAPVKDALPDPGYINSPLTDIGKVFHYEVTGVQGSIYGTDTYTTGSSLGTAAVHCGLLKIGEKGVVRVTILPGQASYTASTRHGITSHAYTQWSVSFKVDRGSAFPLLRGGFTIVAPKPGG